MHSIFFDDLLHSDVARSLRIEKLAEFDFADPVVDPINHTCITMYASHVTGEFYVTQCSGEENLNEWKTFHSAPDAVNWIHDLLTAWLHRRRTGKDLPSGLPRLPSSIPPPRSR